MTQQRRLSLDEVIGELLDDDVRPGAIPPGHWCDARCSHGWLSRSLLDQLRELIQPPASLVHDSAGGGKKGKGPAGSPAPWSASAAELVDQVVRGGLALDRQARKVLGFGPLYVRVPPPRRLLLPQSWPTTPVLASQLAPAAAAPTALRHLPDLWRVLRARESTREHPLATGPESIDRQVRGWHRAALVLTGHEVPWPKVGQVQVDAEPKPYVGPVCPNDGDGLCRHQSCRAIQARPRKRWENGRCPYCGSISLRQDPISGNVLCMRPSCRTEDGGRHVWTVDELERLGVIILSELKAGVA